MTPRRFRTQVNLFAAQPGLCVAKFLALSPASSFLIDGEVVIARDDGMPDFQPFRSQRRGNEAVLFAFDLIEHDDDDLRDLLLIDRKRRLAELIGKAKRAVTRDGQAAFPKNWSLRNMPAALSVRERHSRMRPPLLMKV